MASDLGYFKALGLTVDVKLDDTQSDALAGLLHGDIDVDLATVDDYQRRPRTARTPGVMIGTIDELDGGDGVVADASIKSVADLKGKTIAMETDIPAYLLLEIELDKAGLTYSDVKNRYTTGSDALAVFKDPSIAAVGTYQPFMDQIVKVDASRGAHILVSSASYPGYIIDTITVDARKLKKNPTAYRNFLIGVYKAIAFYQKNPDEFIKLAAPHFDLSPADFKASIDGSLTYTDLATAQKYFGTPENPGQIYQVFDTMMKLNMQNGAATGKLSASHSFDAAPLASITQADLQ